MKAGRAAAPAASRNTVRRERVMMHPFATSRRPLAYRDKQRMGRTIMFSRRQLLTGTAATGLTLATQRLVPARAHGKRLIVDSQIHMWPANRPDRPWVPGAKPQIPEPMTIERVVPMIDEAGVDRVVIVPP